MNEADSRNQVRGDPVRQASHELGGHGVIEPLVEQAKITAAVLVTLQVVCGLFSEDWKVLAEM